MSSGRELPAAMDPKGDPALLRGDSLDPAFAGLHSEGVLSCPRVAEHFGWEGLLLGTVNGVPSDASGHRGQRHLCLVSPHLVKHRPFARRQQTPWAQCTGRIRFINSHDYVSDLDGRPVAGCLASLRTEGDTNVVQLRAVSTLDRHHR